MFRCSSFAALAGYVAFFHRSHHLAFVLSAAAVTSIVCGVQVAMAGSPLLAVATLVILAIGVLAVPLSAQTLVHLPGGDALKSHTDPLTGLRNRRGFYRSSRDLIDAPVDGRSQTLTVVMADLDQLKQINDTHGHGDV